MAGDHARAAHGRTDQRLNLLDRRWVKVGARFIEQQHLRLVQNGAADCQPLQHSSRVAEYAFVAAAAQLGLLKQGFDPRCCVVDAVQSRVIAEVLARRQVAVTERLVAKEADL